MDVTEVRHMPDLQEVQASASGAESKASDSRRADELQRGIEELAGYRDSGALSEVEFEERKMDLRWSQTQ